METRTVTNNQIQYRGEYPNQIAYLPNQDTPFTGRVEDFHENGQKKEEGNYKDGKADGLWTEWYENGQKSSEDHY